MVTIRVAPSILAADFTKLGEQVRDAEAGGADVIHIDVMDGRFVPNITMGPLVVAAVRRVTQLPLDVHLMIVEPERHIQAFADAGATTLSIHPEVCPNLHRVLLQIREAGCRVGVAINPHTPTSMLREILYLLDQVIIMTVNPGFGGQEFIPQTLPKIAEVLAMVGDSHRAIDIEVDGGINYDTAFAAAQAGANVLIAGSVIFNADHSVAEGIRILRDAIKQ